MLKKTLAVFIVFSLALILLPQTVNAKRVRVKDYYRKDGTYVPSHYRTPPDGNPYNNYSFPGKYNPNKGKITPGNPNTYLNRATPVSQKSPPDRHWVTEYSYWKNGKLIIVPGHWRTNPNSIGEDNFNCPDNWNPNIPGITPGDREKWLQEYYNQDSYPALSSQKPYFRGLDSTEEYHARGRNYYRNGEFDLAIKDYNQALALNPRSAYLYKDRGIAYGKLGKLNEAIADYTQALRLYSGFADGYYNRAMAYLTLGKYDEALLDLYQAKYLFWDQEDKIETEQFIQEIMAIK